MGSFNKLKQVLTEQIEANQSKLTDILQSKKIQGPTHNDCFEKASHLFQKPIDELDYTIIQKGSKGFFGIGKKPYIIQFHSKITADPSLTIQDTQAHIESDSTTQEAHPTPEIIKDQNGRIQFAMKRSGAFIRVTSPTGTGKAATFKQSILRLESRGFQSYNNIQIKDIVNKASGEWIKIGEYSPHPDLDSKVNISITPSMLKAYITISPPTLLGRTLEVSDIIHALEEVEITHGINKELIEHILDQELYKKSFLIAQGKEVKHGKNASIDFHFDPTTESIRIHASASEKVNYFSDLGVIQSARKGQVLATKIPLTEGEDGLSLTGELIAAKPGEDIPLQVGKNVKLSEDGLQAIAENEGRISYKNSTISIEEVYEIKGNIGLKTGSITFTGDVKIAGNIEDGFSVNTIGNIYVGGTIGKCKVITEGDIFVQGGIVGKDAAEIKSGGSIVAKFIQNAIVVAKNKIVAPEGILHSYTQTKHIYALGKRGTINGGHTQALEEINAKSLGSTSYNETRLEVGFDAEAMSKLQQLDAQLEDSNENLKQVDIELTTLNPRALPNKELPKDKIPIIERLKKAKKDLNIQALYLSEEIQKLKNYFSKIAVKGFIAGQEKVHPGCEIIIRNSVFKVKQEYSFVTFKIQEKDLSIQTLEYREPRETVPTVEKNQKKSKAAPRSKKSAQHKKKAH